MYKVVYPSTDWCIRRRRWAVKTLQSSSYYRAVPFITQGSVFLTQGSVFLNFPDEGGYGTPGMTDVQVSKYL